MNKYTTMACKEIPNHPMDEVCEAGLFSE